MAMTFSSQGCRAAAEDLTRASNTLDRILNTYLTGVIDRVKNVYDSETASEFVRYNSEKANIGVNVTFGETTITLKEFLELKEGDVLKLDTTITDNLSVCINNEKKFLARPGTFKKNIAVKIIDKYDEKSMK